MIDMTSQAQLTDLDLVQEILNGNKAIYELLIRRHNSYLYKVGRAYNFAHQDVEDLMQETYINAFLNLRKFENRSSFRSWIIKIMLNQCYHKKQKLSYKNTLLAHTEFNDNAMPAFSNNNYTDVNKSVINRELSRVIENAVTKIPEDYRLVFSLREMAGLNVAETAEALEISEPNVKVRLNRAKSMLRKEVEKIYTAEDIFEFNLVYCDGMVNRVMAEIMHLNEV